MRRVFRRGRSARAAAIAMMAALPVLAGCTEVVPEERARGDVPVGVPARPAPTTPATSSDGLTQDSLPRPSALGPRWQYRVDNGSVEDGYLGNGTPSVARNPEEVAAVLTPLGCRPVRLPVPESALEVTYAHRDGTPAVGLLLAFRDAETATTFFELRADSVRDCVDWPPARADVTVLRDTADRFVSIRDVGAGGTPVWTEGVQRDGVHVLFMAVSGDDGAAAVTAALT
ncbi:MAG: hypothetical protein OEV62_07965 [Actinomycetota bacterium]|nr:hypothetical protein [Actinomycetota bacterium]